jgi:hypothetical protein
MKLPSSEICSLLRSQIKFLTTVRHYQDAYDVLVIMFGSPAILPPRTKRWAEAKVLADTINIKVLCPPKFRFALNRSATDYQTLLVQQ